MSSKSTGEKSVKPTDSDNPSETMGEKMDRFFEEAELSGIKFFHSSFPTWFRYESSIIVFNSLPSNRLLFEAPMGLSDDDLCRHDDLSARGSCRQAAGELFA